MGRPHAALSLLVALVTLTTTPAAAQTVTELYVTPDTVRLAAGSRQSLTVQAFDESGNAILSFTFRSDDSTIAQVATNGSVTGGRAGRTRLTVQAGDKSRTVAVVVTGPSGAAPVASTGSANPPRATRPVPAPRPTVARLIAEPVSITLLAGQQGSIVMHAFNAEGATVPLPPLEWRSLTPGVASFDPATGAISGLSVGQTVLQVTSAGTSAAVAIPVTVTASDYRLSPSQMSLAPEDRDSIVATIPSLNNRPVPTGMLQWTVSDPGIIDLGPDGKVRALAPGHTDIVVRGFLQERRIPVVVHRRVAHVVVAPRTGDPIRMLLQNSREFMVIPQTTDSIPVEGVPIVWTLSDTTVATFDTASGILKPRHGGTTTLSFAVGGLPPRSWTIEVIPGAVSLSATRLVMRPSEQSQLTATFVDPQGKPVGPATGLEWTTSDASVAKISAAGMVQSVTPGRATITAQTPGGQPVQATVLVTGDLLVASSRGGNFGIYAIATAAPEQFIPIVVDSGNNVDPSYSPDRSRLAYASDRAGSLDLYIADADGRKPVRLTADPAPESQPVWSPDGRRLVFTATRAGARQLYVISADGGEARQLTSLPGGAFDPVVSPNGQSVAFAGALTSSRDAQTDIFTIPLQGGMPTAVTATKDRRELGPSYLPNGTLTWLLQRKDRKEPDQVLQQPHSGLTAAPLFSSALAVESVALSGDGSRIAWVGSRSAEGARTAPEFTLQWRTLSSGAETSVRLLPGERITSPTF